MTYSITYGVRYFGTILTGPNAGRVLDRHEMDLIDITDEGEAGQAAAFARAESDLAGKFRGRIEVYSKQFKERGPGRKKGGFEFITLGERIS